MAVKKKKALALACDHAGLPLKEELKKHLDDRGIEYLDLGTNDAASVDYPVFAHKLCLEIASGRCDAGVLCCGTGIGMCMAANKHPGIRAAVVSDTFSARMTRMHNDANVLCLGARVVGAGLACDILDLFLDTPYEGGRHQRRVDMLNALDERIPKAGS